MKKENILSKINSPKDLKDLPEDKLEPLCEEIREKIISTVSRNGGHLASNLGVVELTVALHRVFSNSNDKIVWDVGHQCYTHKILTGRLSKIDTIRKENGLSGFPRRSESIYDPFSTGHSSTSISAAYGLLNAKRLNHDNGKVIAVIGDGALSGGLAYEGINNAGAAKKNFIVILNDNKMSISKNVGSMAKYLSAIRTQNIYLKTKSIVDKTLTHMPVLGKFMRKLILKSTSTLKNMAYNGTIFENLGFMYYGPIDGHDIKALINVLNIAKEKAHPVLVHINTVKGKGYSFAEKNPKVFHGISGFNVETGVFGISKSDFSSVFGKELCELAKNDDRVCAITAAMKIGTGLSSFAKNFKNRFFDVGIAEGHAVTFAGGLAAGGMIPVFAVYSTFLQRSYDQIIHDAALQGLKIVLAIDRAGLVGEDGETHHGVFDVSFLNSIPGVTIYSPSFFSEVGPMLKEMIYNTQGVVAIRYPRSGQMYKPENFTSTHASYDIYGNKNMDVVIVTYGRLFSQACLAKERLEIQGINACIIKLNRIKPIDEDAVLFAQNFNNVFFFEEGMLSGGVGEYFEYMLSQVGHKGKFKLTAIGDKFVTQATVQNQLHELELDADGIEKIILRSVERIDKQEEIGFTAV